MGELPTGFGDAGDEAIKGTFAKGETGAAEFAQVSVAPAAHRATVNHTDRVGVARQLGQAGVVALRFQFGANGRVFLDHFGLLLVAFNPGSFSHSSVDS